ncbi:hypothetical protein HK097_000208 [Rhizophlyctis rosea]|uniref:Uncharacterized protein n=1 Tax=Rhizophlyctis rosea TaxID=64517 RepID=A0AAD5S5W5_9FUNG|nr:hypothetical protein HK097_000208 [Rhizophlyctis rosea]
MPPKKAKKKSLKSKASTATSHPDLAPAFPTWPNSLNPEVFAARAIELRTALQQAERTALVTLRVRQQDWEYHDFLVTLPKTASVYMLMRIIASVQHGGAVAAEDVGVFVGRPDGEDGQDRDGDGRQGDTVMEEKGGGNGSGGGSGGTNSAAPAITVDGADTQNDKENRPKENGSVSATSLATSTTSPSTPAAKSTSITYLDPFATLLQTIPDAYNFHHERPPGTAVATAIFVHDFLRQVQPTAASYQTQPTALAAFSTHLNTNYNPLAHRPSAIRSSFAVPNATHMSSTRLPAAQPQPHAPPQPPQLPPHVSLYYTIVTYANANPRPSTAAPSPTDYRPANLHTLPSTIPSSALSPGLDRSDALLMQSGRGTSRPRSAGVALVGDVRYAKLKFPRRDAITAL